MSSLDTAIEFFRRHRSEMFRAEGRITRTTTDGVFNPLTGNIGNPVEATIYEGPCTVREMTWQGSDVTTGDREIRLRQSVLILPADIDIEEDDMLVMTSSIYDPSIIGKHYRITDVFLDTWQITRRAILEKVTRGPE